MPSLKGTMRGLFSALENLEKIMHPLNWKSKTSTGKSLLRYSVVQPNWAPCISMYLLWIDREIHYSSCALLPPTTPPSATALHLPTLWVLRGPGITIISTQYAFLQKQDFKEADVCGPSKINRFWTIWNERCPWNFFILFGISLMVIKLEFGYDCLHVNNPGGRVRCFLYVQWWVN